MQDSPETHIRSLGGEDHVEEEMATDFSILVWRVPWTEEPGGLQSKELQRIGHDWVTKYIHMHSYCIKKSYISKTKFLI